jgi:heme/copper-type cytochrome/quinol oxidase subunit 2
MMFLMAFTSTVVVAGAVVVTAWHFVRKQQAQFRSHQIDREYEQLCEDPRYRSTW